jgi:hypothetical protein
MIQILRTLALTILVGGCSIHGGSATGNDSATDVNESADPPPNDLVSRVKTGDTTVCTDSQVKQTALNTIVGSTDLQAFARDGGHLGPLEDVSAIGVNRDVGEISCSASLRFNGGRTSPFEYDVRPALEQGGGIIVETKMSEGDRDTVNKYILIIKQSKWSHEEQTNATDEIESNDADVQRTPADNSADPTPDELNEAFPPVADNII